MWMTESNMELRSSPAADCVIPLGAIAEETGLTDNCATIHDDPLMPFGFIAW